MTAWLWTPAGKNDAPETASGDPVLLQHTDEALAVHDREGFSKVSSTMPIYLTIVKL